MTVKDIISVLEDFASPNYQESYDNSGLIIGSENQTIESVLLTIDVTIEVLDEAIKKGAGLIIAHHPIIFEGLKRITGSNLQQEIIIKAIKHDIAIYAAHTNFDNVNRGVSYKMSEKLLLRNTKVLRSLKGGLFKIVCYVPKDQIDEVREAMFDAGAGVIGNYDKCSFNLDGKGTFRGGEDANPYVGEKGKLHFEEEVRVETIVPSVKLKNVVTQMIAAHPYEEVAYDIYPLENENPLTGMGMIGELEKEMEEKEFLDHLKEVFKVHLIRHSKLPDKKIMRIALCGGAGSFLLRDAIAQKADIFITGDFKYHQFFDAENKIIIADIGHYESEQYTKDIFYELLIKKFPKFAIHFSEVNTNPINYY
ncbi:MAG: Nif3-like dinuclear metal center hexameric protein [Bacteroidales bacterium]|nr:Nif3-like dinuclear metal center hexameric protein [Bacteroidales bacterium]